MGIDHKGKTPPRYPMLPGEVTLAIGKRPLDIGLLYELCPISGINQYYVSIRLRYRVYDTSFLLPFILAEVHVKKFSNSTPT
jgi:hypothetical protein